MKPMKAPIFVLVVLCCLCLLPSVSASYSITILATKEDTGLPITETTVRADTYTNESNLVAGVYDEHKTNHTDSNGLYTFINFTNNTLVRVEVFPGGLYNRNFIIISNFTSTIVYEIICPIDSVTPLPIMPLLISTTLLLCACIAMYRRNLK
jgi:hypothetical protein